jgi:protein tyrosine phosphatase (PTP) superfamily phosphohydrolase (DUF442 family)
VIASISRLLFACFISILFLAVTAHPVRGLSTDLPNFGQVTENLYRGAQPTSNGFAELKTMGVGLIINFREDPSEIAVEKREVESLGMVYIGMPWNAHDKLSSANVERFLETIRDHSETKMFVHCKRGADRTGLMVAAYRIAMEHEKVADALSEMYQYHFAGFWHPQVARYVKALPELIENDPAFKALAQVQAPAGRGAGKIH